MKIEVPVCKSCGKPHYGRKEPLERCWCDTCMDWEYGLIEEELENPTPSSEG